MQHLLSAVRGWVFDKGAKIAAGGGAVAVLLSIFDRIANEGETAHFCLTLDSMGGMLTVAAGWYRRLTPRLTCNAPGLPGFSAPIMRS